MILKGISSFLAGIVKIQIHHQGFVLSIVARHARKIPAINAQRRTGYESGDFGEQINQSETTPDEINLKF